MQNPFYNIANQLTLVRILFIPLLVLIYYTPLHHGWQYFISAALFGLAGLTDLLDGYIARKYKLTTPFGAFLDPVADKLMVAVALTILIQRHNDIWFTLPATVIICREIVISALREWMAEIGQRANVAVSMIGKFKTTLQIIAIVILLAFNPDRFPRTNNIGYWALYVAAVLTLWSMIVYLRAAWPSLKGGGKVKKTTPEA